MMSSRAFESLLKIIALCVLAVNFVFAVKSYTVDSELWSVSVARFFFEPSSYHNAVYNKSLFYFLLDLLYVFPFSNLVHVVVAKTLFAINAVALAYFSFRVFAVLAARRMSAWLALIVMATSPLWLAESFRIRSDLLAMTLTMAALSCALFRSEEGPLRTTISKAVIACMIGSLLATPKSIVWNFPLALFLIGTAYVSEDGYRRRAWREIMQSKPWRKNVMIGATFLGVVAGAALFDPIYSGYASAWRHFTESLKRASALGSAPWMVDWFFMVDSLKAMPLYWVLAGAGMLGTPLLLWRLRRRSEFGLLASLWLFVCCFVAYSPKLYFFIASCWPLLMMPVVFLFDAMLAKSGRMLSRTSASLVGVFLLVPLMSFSYWSWHLFPMHEGGSTYQLIEDLDAFLKRPSVKQAPPKIFDGMGLLPRANTVLAYFSEADRVSNIWGVWRVLEGKPDLILFTSRLATFWPRLRPAVLEPEFKEVQTGLWLRNSNIALMAAAQEAAPITHVDEPAELFSQRLHCLGASAGPKMRWDFSGLGCF